MFLLQASRDGGGSLLRRRGRRSQPLCRRAGAGRTPRTHSHGHGAHRRGGRAACCSRTPSGCWCAPPEASEPLCARALPAWNAVCAPLTRPSTQASWPRAGAPRRLRHHYPGLAPPESATKRYTPRHVASGSNFQPATFERAGFQPARRARHALGAMAAGARRDAAQRKLRRQRAARRRWATRLRDHAWERARCRSGRPLRGRRLSCSTSSGSARVPQLDSARHGAARAARPALTQHPAPAPPAGAAAPRWRACTTLRLLCVAASLLVTSAAQCPSATLAQVVAAPATTFLYASVSCNGFGATSMWPDANGNSACAVCFNALARPFRAAGVTDPSTLANCTLAFVSLAQAQSSSFNDLLLSKLLDLHDMADCTAAELTSAFSTMSPLAPPPPPPAPPPLVLAPAAPLMPPPPANNVYTPLPLLPVNWVGDDGVTPVYLQSVDPSTGVVTVTFTQNFMYGARTIQSLPVQTSSYTWNVPPFSKYVLTSNCSGGCDLSSITINVGSPPNTTVYPTIINGAQLTIVNVKFASVSFSNLITSYAGSILTIINSTLPGIYTMGQLSVSNSVFGLYASSGMTDGGVIYAASSALNVTIHNTTFYGCGTIGRGGCIYAANSDGTTSIAAPLAGNVYVYDSTFNGCSAGVDGGCIYGGNVYIYRTVFYYSTAKGQGGAVYAVNSLTFIASACFGAYAVLNGGCLYASHVRFSGQAHPGMVQAVFSAQGGTSKTVYVYYLQPMIVADSIFSSCSAGSSGGAVYAEFDAVITRSGFISNSAGVDGGAVYTPSLTESGVPVQPIDPATGLPWGPTGWIGNISLYYNPPDSQSNSAVPPPATVYRMPMLNVSGSYFVTNAAYTYGGAIAVGLSIAVTVDRCTFVGHSTMNAIGRGGAVSVLQGTLTVSNSVFSSNSVPTLGGGALFFGTGALSLLSSNFSHNSGSFFAQGGAVHFQTIWGFGTNTPPFVLWQYNPANSLTVVGCNFDNNNAQGLTDRSLATSFSTVLNLPYGSDVLSNSASGGAIFVKLDYYSNVSVTITDSTFTSNSAAYGGALAMLPSQTKSGRLGTPSLNISRCIFDGNTAHVSGGVLALGASASAVLPAFAVSILDCVFSNNFVAYDFGAGLTGDGGVIALTTSGAFSIADSVFDSNWAASTGATFSINATAPMQFTMRNSIVSGSHAKFGAFAAISGGNGLAIQLDTVTVLNQIAEVGALYYTAPGVLMSSIPLPSPPPPSPPPSPPPPSFPSGLPAGPFPFYAQGNSTGFVSPLNQQFYTLDTGKEVIEQLTGETVFLTITQIGFSTTVLVQVDVATPPSPPFPPYPPPPPPAPPVYLPPSFVAGVSYSNMNAKRYGSLFGSLPVTAAVSPQAAFTVRSGDPFPTINITIFDLYSQVVQAWPDLLVSLSATGPAQPPSSSVPSGLSGPLTVLYANGAATFAALAIRDVIGAAYSLTFTLASPTIGALNGQTINVTATVAPCGAQQIFSTTTLSCLCNAGTYLLSSGSCVPCAPGTFTSTTGSTSCSLCSPGSYSVPARTSCTPCAAGTFLNSSSQLCQPCSPGSYSPAAGAVACTVNPPGFASSTQTTFTSNVTLAGVSSANFGAAQNATLATTIASTLAVPASAVAITAVTSATPAGRHLLQASAAVAFAVTTTNTTQASAMRSALNATAAFSGALATSLRSSADPVLSVTTGVITTAPAETALVLAALPCPAGTFLNGLTQNCDPCAVGLVTTTSGASTCAKCPLRSAWVSSSSCVVCPSNSVTSPSNPGQCACDFGYYDTLFGANLTAPVCETCPLGGKCTTGFVGAEAGFWRESTLSAFFYQCREGNCMEEDISGPLIIPPNVTARRKLMQAAGNASVPSNCVDGNTGPLCALCLPGYSLQSGVCAPCDPQDAFENWSEGSRSGLIIGCAVAGVIIIAFALFQPLSPGLEFAATKIWDAASAAASWLKEALVSCVTCACRSSSSGRSDLAAPKIDEDAARDPDSEPTRQGAMPVSSRNVGAASLGLGGMMGGMMADDNGGGEGEDEGGSESDGAVDVALDFQDEMEEMLEKLQKYAKIIIKCVARSCLPACFTALTRHARCRHSFYQARTAAMRVRPRLGCR